MKDKNYKKIIIICLLCFSMIFVFAICIMQIYAVFQSEVSGDVSMVNGVWQIKVNNTDIASGTNKEFTVDEINAQVDNHVKPGNLAPGLSGSFDVEINPENTDVSIRYDISFNQEKIMNDSIAIKSITEIQNGKELIKTGENTYTGVITLDEINQGITDNIRVEIEWIDDETNNEIDTEMGIQGDYKIKIPIVVHVIQYLGEEIVPYE